MHHRGCGAGRVNALGALVYGTKLFNRRDQGFWRHWGFHEVWHLFVLGGTGAHVAMMFSLR